jgi:transposase
MIPRTGEVVIRMLGDVKPATIGPIIQETISKGTVISTDEYAISARLPEGGYPPHRLPCGGRVRP